MSPRPLTTADLEALLTETIREISVFNPTRDVLSKLREKVRRLDPVESAKVPAPAEEPATPPAETDPTPAPAPAVTAGFDIG